MASALHLVGKSLIDGWSQRNKMSVSYLKTVAVRTLGHALKKRTAVVLHPHCLGSTKASLLMSFYPQECHNGVMQSPGGLDRRRLEFSGNCRSHWGDLETVTIFQPYFRVLTRRGGNITVLLRALWRKGRIKVWPKQFPRWKKHSRKTGTVDPQDSLLHFKSERLNISFVSVVEVGLHQRLITAGSWRRRICQGLAHPFSCPVDSA